MNLRSAALLATSLMAWSASASAEAPKASAPDAAVRDAAGLRESGDIEGALDVLKAAVQSYPDEERLSHALAATYLADDNDFWALKVLRAYEEAHPPACDTVAFRAWIHLKQANLDLADELLGAKECDRPQEVRARFLLLRSRVAAQRGDAAKSADLAEQARSSSSYYAEDLAALDALRARREPGRQPFATWRIDFAVGWTSNGLAGSPQDPADIGQKTSSSVGVLDARTRLIVPAWPAVRPVLEAQVRAMQLFADNMSALSYRQPSLRPGVLLGATYPRLLITYGFDAVQIAGGDRYDEGPRWYSEGHRFDYELEATDGLFAFGGGGHRWYREAGRTRWEFEQGLAGGTAITGDLRMMAGASARWHRANSRPYDANGGTLLAQLLYRLPGSFEARLNGSISHDDYFRSHGAFSGSVGDKRVDTQVRVKPGLWSPSWSGWRLGLDYELSKRTSTTENYAYVDHRVLLHATWALDTDRFGVEAISAEGREPMHHGVASAGQLSEEELRIRDLMRQDEAVKRGSSCLN